MTQANQAPPTYKCRVCGGKGYTFFEEAAGRPTQQRPCGFCKGSGTDQWVHVNHAQAARQEASKAKRWRIAGIVFILAVSATAGLPFWAINGTNTSPWILVHLLLSFLSIFAVCRLVITTNRWRAWKARRVERANDGFTSTEERVLGTAFIAGSALKFQHDQRLRRDQQFQDQVTDYMRRHP